MPCGAGCPGAGAVRGPRRALPVRTGRAGSTPNGRTNWRPRSARRRAAVRATAAAVARPRVPRRSKETNRAWRVPTETATMSAHILVAGGGIAGLASALALGRRRHRIDLLEQAVAFTEVGAGIQLGPNVPRRLHALGVWEALTRVAARPDALVVRSAASGTEIARMPLGN